MDLAIENDMIILPVKQRNKDSGEIEKKIVGYKIAGKEDSEYISLLLEDKEKRANAYVLSYNKTLTELEGRKLLVDGRYELKMLQ